MTFCENLPLTYPPTFWPRVCNFSMWDPLVLNNYIFHTIILYSQSSYFVVYAQSLCTLLQLCVCVTVCLCLVLGDSCRSPASSSGSRRRKGVSPGQPTKHDPVICGRRNVQNIDKVLIHSFLQLLYILAFISPLYLS